MGEANSLIVVADDALWQQVEEQTYAALERTVYTTRNEKIFNVTQTAPSLRISASFCYGGRSWCSARPTTRASR